MPHDVLAVSRASTVYVIGEVRKAGGFPIGDENTMTVVQALSMAQGCEHTADLKNARIIRNPQLPGNVRKSFATCARYSVAIQKILTYRPGQSCMCQEALGRKLLSKHLRLPLPPGLGWRSGASASSGIIFTRFSTKATSGTRMNSFHYLDDPRRDPPPAPLPPVVSTRYYSDADRFASAEEDDSGKLLEYVLTLYRHKGLLLSFALIGMVVTLCISLPQKPIYRAQVAVEIQVPSENFLNKGFDNAPSGNNDAAETYFQTQIRLLRSESLLQRAAAKLNLHDNANAGQRSKWRDWLGLPQKAPLSEADRLIRQLNENLTVRVSGLTRVVEVLYDSPDPALAADVANTIVTGIH